jgi:hypothetical protein
MGVSPTRTPTVYPGYNTLLNIDWYQVLWLVAVLGRDSSTAVLLLLLALHMYWCRRYWRAELGFVLACSAVGIAADSVLTLYQVFIFPPSAPALTDGLWPLPIPFWLVAIWLSFTATLRHSLRFLLTRPWLAVLLGAGFAPSSYMAGVYLGAVQLGLGVWPTLALLTGVWALLMAMFVAIHQRLAAGFTRPANPGTH